MLIKVMDLYDRPMFINPLQVAKVTKYDDGSERSTLHQSCGPAVAIKGSVEALVAAIDEKLEMLIPNVYRQRLEEIMADKVKVVKEDSDIVCSIAFLLIPTNNGQTTWLDRKNVFALMQRSGKNIVRTSEDIEKILAKIKPGDIIKIYDNSGYIVVTSDATNHTYF